MSKLNGLLVLIVLRMSAVLFITLSICMLRVELSLAAPANATAHSLCEQTSILRCLVYMLFSLLLVLHFVLEKLFKELHKYPLWTLLLMQMPRLVSTGWMSIRILQLRFVLLMLPEEWAAKTAQNLLLIGFAFAMLFVLDTNEVMKRFLSQCCTSSRSKGGDDDLNTPLLRELGSDESEAIDTNV